MPPPKERLKQLYLNEQKSAAEIAASFRCSPNKVNYWIKKYGITKRNIADAMYAKHNPDGDPFLVSAPNSQETAFLYGLGLGLYWGEGTKKNKLSIRLGNTDPRLILKFLEFLKKIYGIKEEKLKFGLQIFSDMPPKIVLSFWKKALGVSASQFQKVVVTPTRGVGTYRQKMKYGVLTVYYHNKKLRDILVKSIENL